MLEVGRGELLKDFEQNLIGMEAGERKQFGVTFPMDYAEASLRGQSVLFHVHLKEMLGSFERSLRAQGMEPGQYYQLGGTSAQEIKDRVRPDAMDTVRKELTLDAVATAEDIRAS